MSEEEIDKAIKEMEKEFGPLPNPEHEPRRFAYLVKIYLYLKNG